MSNTKQDTKNCFQLKADFFPITVFKLASYDLMNITEGLKKIIDSAPKYFQYAPIIIDINELVNENKSFNLNELCDVLRKYKIIPVGVRGWHNKEEVLANNYNLALISQTKTLPGIKPKDETFEKNKFTQTKIISKPVRAGTRVYAKNGDLVILSAINAGGECIADGNIHIYGPLRGRVLAGASGNTEARIFCRKIDAELISIAGHYLINEAIKSNKMDSLIQIYLKDNALKIEAI